MFLPLAAAASFVWSPKAQIQATATVRIERPAIANAKDWHEAPQSNRREVIIRDDEGHPVLLRLVEYQ